jgi:hypothetical protein
MTMRAIRLDRGHDGCLEDPKGRSGDARYRQHGRLSAGGAISGPHHQMGGDRRAAARHCQLGRGQTEPAAMALQLPRSGRGTAGSRPRALSADPKKIDEATRQHYAALYARPHAMHDAFEQFGAFNQDGIDNKAILVKGDKLTMSVLALAGTNPSARQRRIPCASWRPMSRRASSQIPAIGSWTIFGFLPSQDGL